VERVVNSFKTGETFTFSDEWNTSSGKVKHLMLELKPGKKVQPHYHPHSSQSFKVLKGRLHLQVNRKNFEISEGEEFTAHAGDEHSQWNEGPDIALIMESYDPPICIEPFFTALPESLSHWHKFKFFILLDDFSEVLSTRSTIGRAAVRIIAKIGRWIGYSNWYKRTPQV